MSVTTNQTSDDTEMSDTVKSLLDLESSTVCLDSYKGRPTLAINKDSKYPFSFGLPKAKLILKHIEALRNFVNSNGQRVTAG